eukprot:4640781-Lingulodinium_polyedra.AAC.1
MALDQSRPPTVVLLKLATPARRGAQPKLPHGPPQRTWSPSSAAELEVEESVGGPGRRRGVL